MNFEDIEYCMANWYSSHSVYKIFGEGSDGPPILPTLILCLLLDWPGVLASSRSRSVLSAGPKLMFSTVYPLIKSANQYGPETLARFPSGLLTRVVFARGHFFRLTHGRFRGRCDMVRVFAI
jgi:hypothetical protein